MRNKLLILVGGPAAVWLLVNVGIAVVNAQTSAQRLQSLGEADVRIDGRIASLDERLKKIEEMKVEARMSALEERSATIYNLLVGIALAVAIQIILQSVRIAQTAKKDSLSNTES